MSEDKKVITVTDRFCCDGKKIEVSGRCYFDGFGIDELLERISLSEVKEYVARQEKINER